MISDYVKNEIKSHAEQDVSKECCGFIFENNILRCNNLSEKPARHFSISPFDYVKATKKGKIKAIYHSHISENQNFSIHDKQMSRGHNIPYVLYHLKTKNFLCFDPKKERVVDIDKKFVLGKSDCYSLVKNYYKKLGITLTDSNTPNPNLFTLVKELFELNEFNIKKEWDKFDFQGITKLKKHDLIVFEMIKGEGPCHVGAYLGEGIMYHHPRNRFPTTEELNDVIQRKIYKIYRHQELNEQG